LTRAQQQYAAGMRDGAALRATMRAILDAEPLARTEYVSAADPLTLQELDQVSERGALLSLAVRIGKTRLIDNVILK
jgi:pantoate--beta-alanine ligase